MSGDGFFASLAGLEADEAMARCTARGDELRADIARLQQQLAQTPLGDKQGAHAIRQDILRAQSGLHRLKPVIASYRATLENRETHYLWTEGVRAICGQDLLRDVYAWMAAEKKRRRREAAAARDQA